MKAKITWRGKLHGFGRRGPKPEQEQLLCSVSCQNQNRIQLSEIETGTETITKNTKFQVSENLTSMKSKIFNGADIHVDEDHALRLSCERGNFDIVKYLVENGADIYAKDNDSLKFAKRFGHFDIVNYLVENGADVHEYNDYSLKSAIKLQHWSIEKYIDELIHSKNNARNSKRKMYL
ncbi:hypothetical protein BB558_003168 [Smittium angustum]|uniref:Uncharacterized protein n=1 Tax=Smittium angustum TaxID=133377 RepID=A0A2U1J6T6_SMIAN|nr:hypothetical protein BB558_003168 [Smittium angustum]